MFISTAANKTNKLEVNIACSNALIIAFDYINKKYKDLLEEGDCFSISGATHDNFFGLPKKFPLKMEDIFYMTLHIIHTDKQTLKGTILNSKDLATRKAWNKLLQELQLAGSGEMLYFKPAFTKKLLKRKVVDKTYAVIIAHYLAYAIVGKDFCEELQYKASENLNVVKAKKSIITREMMKKAKALGFSVVTAGNLVYFDMRDMAKDMYTFLKMTGDIINV